MIHRTKLLLLASAAAMAVSGHARAQTKATTVVSSDAVQEVVVTARKTSERIEDVPLAITSYNTKDLADRGIVGLKDIAQMTPGFVFQSYSSSFDASPTIRGLTQFDVTSSVANVSTVVNGVYVPRNYSVDLGIADVSNVEIVKGPQSALYGGNAFAGVIAYTLAQPTAKPHADLSLTGGTDGRFDGKIDVSGSLFNDTLQGRAYFGHSEFDGTWKNDFPTSGPEQHIGGHNNNTYGFALKYKPNSKIEADVDYFHLDTHEDIKPAYNIEAGTYGDTFNCGTKNLLLCGTISTNPKAYDNATSTRPPGLLIPPEPGFTAGTDFLDAQLKVELAPNLNATYLFGHVRSNATEITSSAVNPVSGVVVSYAALFGAPVPFFQALDGDQKEGGVSELNSHEFRLDYTWGHLKVLAGFYYSSNDDLYQFNIWQVPDGAGISGGAPDHPTNFTAFPFALEGHDLTTNTTAEFGRISYGFLDDRLTAAAEVRHSSDDLNYDDTTNKKTYKTSFDNTTPRFTLDYKLTPNSLLYASAAEGVKDGGFNSTNSAFALEPSQQSFQPETNWTYEVGTKNTFFGGRAVINADVFYIDWDKLQIQEEPANTPAALAGTTSVITVNFGGATSYGFESDGFFSVTHNLDVTYAVAALDPTFKSGTLSQRFLGACNGVACPANASVGGNTLPRTSKYQAAGGATWKDTIMDKYQWNIHGEFTYQSEQEAEEENLAQIQSRLLFNASAGIKGSNWDLTIWGKNIFNKKYVADSFFELFSGSASYGVSLGELATAGVTLNVHY